MSTEFGPVVSLKPEKINSSDEYLIDVSDLPNNLPLPNNDCVTAFAQAAAKEAVGDALFQSIGTEFTAAINNASLYSYNGNLGVFDPKTTDAYIQLKNQLEPSAYAELDKFMESFEYEGRPVSINYDPNNGTLTTSINNIGQLQELSAHLYQSGITDEVISIPVNQSIPPMSIFEAESFKSYLVFKKVLDSGDSLRTALYNFSGRTTPNSLTSLVSNPDNTQLFVSLADSKIYQMSQTLGIEPKTLDALEAFMDLDISAFSLQKKGSILQSLLSSSHPYSPAQKAFDTSELKYQLVEMTEDNWMQAQKKHSSTDAPFFYLETKHKYIKALPTYTYEGGIYYQSAGENGTAYYKLEDLRFDGTDTAMHVFDQSFDEFTQVVPNTHIDKSMYVEDWSLGATTFDLKKIAAKCYDRGNDDGDTGLPPGVPAAEPDAETNPGQEYAIGGDTLLYGGLVVVGGVALYMLGRMLGSGSKLRFG